MEHEKYRFYITRNGKSVRWIKQFINPNIIWDGGVVTHLVVTMENSYNEAHRPNDVKVESVYAKDCFSSQEKAEMEIIRRERFER